MDQELQDVVEVCGLKDFIESHSEKFNYIISANGLSGGERQRIAAARALIRKPSLLVLDEPGNHIDECGYADLKKIIECAKDHTSILLITHDMKLAALADRIITMDNTKRIKDEDNRKNN